MTALPDLPVELGKPGSPPRTADTASDYWNLVARGYTVEGLEESLTPQQKAARTRAANKAAADEDDSQEGATDTAGDATGDES